MRGGTLTLALPRDAINFDPLRSNDAYSTTVMATVLDSLYELDQEGKVRGRLVEKTENPQPNVYLMTLRRGVTFHDGTALDAEAVRFNLRRHLETPGSARGQDVRDITALEVLDPLTLRVTLRDPFAPFPGKLIGGAGYIVSPAAVQRLGEALQRDLTGAGSGPYRFVQWQKDTQVVVERNAGYWKKNATGESLPYLDRIVFRPFPDENVRLANLRTGDADALVDNPPYKDIAALKGDPSLSVRELPGLGFSLFLLNTRAEPFDNPAVRRAFSLAIDREQLVKTVFFGNGRPLDGDVPETISWAYQREDRPYMRRDLARARAELQGAGKAGGVRFTMQVPNNSPERLQIAELVQDQIKEAGLEMEIRPLDFGTVLANGSAGAFDALSLGTSGDVDPDGNLYSLTHSASAQNLGSTATRRWTGCWRRAGRRWMSSAGPRSTARCSGSWTRTSPSWSTSTRPSSPSAGARCRATPRPTTATGARATWSRPGARRPSACSQGTPRGPPSLQGLFPGAARSTSETARSSPRGTQREWCAAW